MVVWLLHSALAMPMLRAQELALQAECHRSKVPIPQPERRTTMCHPCWLNVKRVTLNFYATYQEGQGFVMTHDLLFMADKATVMGRYLEEWGVLLIVRILSSRSYYPTAYSALWCPTYGAGGWVDENKDAKVKQLLQVYRQAEEAEVLNCMAL